MDVSSATLPPPRSVDTEDTIADVAAKSRRILSADALPAESAGSYEVLIDGRVTAEVRVTHSHCGRCIGSTCDGNGNDPSTNRSCRVCHVEDIWGR